MSAARPLTADSAEGPVRYTRDEYLAHERAAETKSEYFQGEAWPMVGGSLNHAQIVTNLVRLLGTQFLGKSVQVLNSDMRVRAGQSYFYPDLVVVEGPQLEDTHKDTLLNPTVVIEVLSPSTEAFDRGRKFMAYRSIETLREYILVSQDSPRVEHYQRQPGGKCQWMLTVAEGLDASVLLLRGEVEGEPLSVELREVFDRVEFGAESTESGISAGKR